MNLTYSDNLPTEKNLLIIGGSGRNVGKTTLALEIIKRTVLLSPVTALKVSAFKKGDEEFHGSHNEPVTSAFRISAEKGDIPHKDTAMMLKAGASDAHFIESPDYLIPDAWNFYKENYNKLKLPVVCESRSLRKHVRPGLFILLINPDNLKDNQTEYISMADYIHQFTGDLKDIVELAKKIDLTPEGWKIRKI